MESRDILAGFRLRQIDALKIGVGYTVPFWHGLTNEAGRSYTISKNLYRINRTVHPNLGRCVSPDIDADPMGLCFWGNRRLTANHYPAAGHGST